MFKPKSIILIITASLVLTALSGVVGGFPLRFIEPVFCIQMVGAMCPPFTILWLPLLVDFVFWLVISTAGFLGLKVLSTERLGKRGSSSIGNFLASLCDWKYISVIIFVAVISGGGVYLLQGRISARKLESSERIEKILREQIKNYQIRVLDLEGESRELKKGWRPYTNEMLGFSILYPGEWSLPEERILSTKTEVEFDGLDITIGQFYDQNRGRPLSYLEVAEWLAFGKEPAHILVDGYPAVYLKIRDEDLARPKPNPYNLVVIQKGETVYQLYVMLPVERNFPEEYQEMQTQFDRIVSSFKFLEK